MEFMLNREGGSIYFDLATYPFLNYVLTVRGGCRWSCFCFQPSLGNLLHVSAIIFHREASCVGVLHEFVCFDVYGLLCTATFVRGRFGS